MKKLFLAIAVSMCISTAVIAQTTVVDSCTRMTGTTNYRYDLLSDGTVKEYRHTYSYATGTWSWVYTRSVASMPCRGIIPA